MGLAQALLLANILYLILWLLAFLYVEGSRNGARIVEMRSIRKQEMYDWSAKFQVANDNIKHCKRQQWYVMYLCLIVYALVVLLHQLFPSDFRNNAFVALVAFVATLAVLDFGIYIVLGSEFEMRKERLNLLKLQIIRAYHTKNHIHLRDCMGRIYFESKILSNPAVFTAALLVLVLGFTTVFYFVFRF
jgi:hypothetical protein